MLKEWMVIVDGRVEDRRVGGGQESICLVR